MRLRFVSWNVRGSVRRGQPEFLAERQWDVCAVQEGTTDARVEELRRRAAADEAVSARPLLAADNRPRYVSVLLARRPWTLAAPAVLDVPSPERALLALAKADGREVAVGSMALPPGVAWGATKKAAQAGAIAAWLSRAASRGSVVLGIDANTPRVDHPDLALTEWWNAGEEDLLGAERLHPARDVYREVVERDPGHLATLRADRPAGPLAVSYRRGGTDCRYDFILASPDLGVTAAAYEWDGAHQAGSDHALVWADLSLPPLP